MKAALIDDELHSIEVLEILLTRHCPAIEIVHVFTKPEEALIALKDSDVDILFLDIEMPKMNGFQFLEKLGKTSVKTIFVTAYHEYAIKAFRFNALDYLLKPIDVDDLKIAVQKIIASHAIKPEVNNYLSELYKNAHAKRILLPLADEMIFVLKEDIICCHADGSYAHIYCSGNRDYFISKNLRELEDMLNHPFFVRVHASWLINEMQILRLTKTDGLMLEMSNKMEVPVSRNKKQEILGRLKNGSS